MATVKRPYGRWSQVMLASLRARGAMKVEAFVEWLADRQIQVSRTLISHWGSGRTHLPADVLPLLASFTGDPPLVFGAFVRDAGFEIVRVPRGTARGRELSELLLEAGAAIGRLQRSLLDALAPDSPGGRSITPQECDALRQHIDDVIRQLADTKAELPRS